MPYACPCRKLLTIPVSPCRWPGARHSTFSPAASNDGEPVALEGAGTGLAEVLVDKVTIKARVLARTFLAKMHFCDCQAPHLCATPDFVAAVIV